MRTVLFALSTIILLLGCAASAQVQLFTPPSNQPPCAFAICADSLDTVNYEGHYSGHDEPELIFFSDAPGSGNSVVYFVRLPNEPPRFPRQDGRGGTFNFQLAPAVWFGMALCDTQSFPNYTHTCVPDTDANIFDNLNPNAPDFIGHHPGTAYMELQFYPPGWVFSRFFSCDAKQWCAAMTITESSSNTKQENNSACVNLVGATPFIQIYITKTGIPTTVQSPDPTSDLFMNPGDWILVDMHDTPDGFRVVLLDLTTGQSGSMTASVANGFAQVVFDPNATTCTFANYAFHPVYSTANRRARVPWAPHAGHIAFSAELGHWEYCDAASADGGNCTKAGVSDPKGVDADDNLCFSPSSPFLFIPIGGCTGSVSAATDKDFDGVSYHPLWPGSTPNPRLDAQLHPEPILFTSPWVTSPSGRSPFNEVAFESPVPVDETYCDIFKTGKGCVMPPRGAKFYPIFSTQGPSPECLWQFGGPHIKGTTHNFGGNAKTEYGHLSRLPFITRKHGRGLFYTNFRRVIENPCLDPF